MLLEVNDLNDRETSHLVAGNKPGSGKARQSCINVIVIAREQLDLDSLYAIIKAPFTVEYAKLEKSRTSSAIVQEVLTFAYVADKYMLEVVPTKGSATQKDNARELKQLLKFFDNPPAALEAIEPQHVVQYLRQRGKTAPVRANREKALLSAIWNFARSSGYTALANPCAGVKGHKEVGRDQYIEDEMFALVYGHAEQPLRDALDLFYLTGQRIADTLKMDERDIRDNQLPVETSCKRGINLGTPLL